MLEEIQRYVSEERERLGIEQLGTSPRSEPSGEAFGEFDLLLDCQLVHTLEGYGGWRELKNREILTGVYGIVARRSLERKA